MGTRATLQFGKGLFFDTNADDKLSLSEFRSTVGYSWDISLPDDKVCNPV